MSRPRRPKLVFTTLVISRPILLGRSSSLAVYCSPCRSSLIYSLLAAPPQRPNPATAQSSRLLRDCLFFLPRNSPPKTLSGVQYSSFRAPHHLPATATVDSQSNGHGRRCGGRNFYTLPRLRPSQYPPASSRGSLALVHHYHCLKPSCLPSESGTKEARSSRALYCARTRKQRYFLGTGPPPVIQAYCVGG